MQGLPVSLSALSTHHTYLSGSGSQRLSTPPSLWMPQLVPPSLALIFRARFLQYLRHQSNACHQSRACHLSNACHQSCGTHQGQVFAVPARAIRRLYGGTSSEVSPSSALNYLPDLLVRPALQTKGRKGRGWQWPEAQLAVDAMQTHRTYIYQYTHLGAHRLATAPTHRVWLRMACPLLSAWSILALTLAKHCTSRPLSAAAFLTAP